MYQTHKMGDFLKHRSEFFTIDDFQEYKRVRVQLHGRGIIQRDSITGSQVKTKKQQAAKAGEFLVAEIDAKVGGFGIVPPELDGAIVSSHYFLFEIDESVCLKEWLDYFVRGGLLTEQVTARGSTNYAAIRPHHVLDFEVPLPSLPEQRRIVGRIEELAGKVEEARRLRVAAAGETTTLLGLTVKAIFEDGRNSGWKPCTVGDIVEEVRYGTSSKAHSEPDGIPVLRMGNIQDGKLDTSDLKYLHLPEREQEKLLLQEGDIVVNRTNSAELVGKCAVFDLSGDYVYASYLIRLRLNPSLANPYFVAYYVNSPIGRAYMFAERKQMTGQANINSQKLQALPIALPDIGEQNRIVVYFDTLRSKVEGLQRLQGTTQKELDALLPAILDKAFKGEL